MKTKFEQFIYAFSFHAIGHSSTGFNELDALFVSESDFEYYIKYLYENGYKTITFSELSNWLLRKKTFNFNPVLIIFDDGYKSILNAYQILEKYGFKGNVFLINNFIGKKSNGFPWNSKAPQILEMLSKDDISELLKSGWEIGAHTLNHKLLDNLSGKLLEEEIKESGKALKRSFNLNINAFAFPRGSYSSGVSAEALKISAEVYELIFTAEFGAISKYSIPFLLERIIITPFFKKENFEDLILKANLREKKLLPYENFIKVYNLASKLKEMGALKISEKIFCYLLKKFPPDGDHTLYGRIYFHLGEIYLKSKNRELAKEYFKSTLLFLEHKKAKEILKELK